MPRTRWSTLAVLTALWVCTVEFALGHDAILLRRKIMKAVGAATKEARELARGERAFDAARASAQMTLIANGWTEAAKLFPEGSHAGARTRAAPEIWTNLADFQAQGERMAQLASRAAAAAGEGHAAFTAAFEELSVTCKGCHRTYMTRD
ncbi:MAG: cytochrome c [Hyphomicrobiaceae bacterium]|nr:cytochrome c [Hyphomicrobiaceae bacterium]